MIIQMCKCGNESQKKKLIIKLTKGGEEGKYFNGV